MKVKPEDTQKFVTVFDMSIGKKDGILVSLLDNGDLVILFPNQSRDDGARCSTCIYNENDVVAIGPDINIEFPKF